MTPFPRRGLAVVASLAMSLGLLWGVPAAAQARSSGIDVVNGRPPSASEFGFLASVEVDAPDGYTYVCGGSFVSPTQVVTAAHCFFDSNGDPVTAVRAGTADGLARPAQPVPASRWQVHEGYSPNGYGNDIAIITLSRPVSGVPTVQIPTAAEWQALVRPGASAGSAGWGATSSGGNAPRNFLVADLTIVPDSVCGDSNQTYRIGSLTYEGLGGNFNPNTMVCAGGATSSGLAIDTCQGDSGGPLVAGTGASLRLVGIVSWGRGCAGMEDGKRIELTPGVYTRLATYLPWLASKGIGQSITVPGQPTGVRAEAASESTILLSWTPPGSDGGSPITSYVIEGNVDGGEWSDMGTFELSGSSIEVTGAEPGVTYQFRVAAVNAVGTGAFSQPSAPFTMPTETVTVPGKVGGFTKTKLTKKGKTYSVTVRWSEPEDDGGAAIEAYLVRLVGPSSSGEWSEYEEPWTNLVYLRPRSTYRVEVRAVNQAGPGPVATYAVKTPR